MQQWLAISFPRLMLDILSVKDDDVFAVYECQKGQPYIVQCTPSAKRLGIHSGMTTSAAMALIDTIELQQRHHAIEKQTLDMLCHVLWQFSHQLSLQSPHIILLEVAASLKLFGGLSALGRRIRQTLEKMGYTTCYVLAEYPASAYVLAQMDIEGNFCQKKKLRRRLNVMPLSYLPISRQDRQALEATGMKTLGQVFQLPSAGLTKRMGQSFVTWLKQIYGEQYAAFTLFQPVDTFYHRLLLPAYISHQRALLFPIKRLLQQLEGWLRARQLAALKLEWLFLLDNDEEVPVCLDLSQAELYAETLLVLMQNRLERLVLSSDVRELSLTVTQLTQPQIIQNSLFEAQKETIDLITRLQSRLGKEAVTGLAIKTDYRPELSYCLCQPGKVSENLSFPDRPLWLLEKPLLLQQRNRRPIYRGELSFRQDRERIETGWWDDFSIKRDYFVVANHQNEKIWIFREDKKWYLHGWFA